MLLYYIIYTYICMYNKSVFQTKCVVRVSANISGPATGQGDSAAICSWCYCCCLVQLVLEEGWGNSFETNM